MQIKCVLDFSLQLLHEIFLLDTYLRIDALDVKEKMAQNAMQVFI